MSAVDNLIPGGLQRQESGIVIRKQFPMGKCVFEEMESFRVPPADHAFDDDYDANHGLWLVSAACLAYGPEETVKHVATELWKMTSVEFFDDPATDTQGFGMANDDFIVIAFRGTESKEDWKTNMKYAKVILSDLERYAKVDVHKGFNTACLSVLPQVEIFIAANGKADNADKPLYVCGHSLGGALATLCYAHLTLRDSPVSVNGVVTIGQPRVGSRRFVQTMLEEGPCLLQRIYNSNDVVPTVC
jgi:triacylglycerol lipase